MDNNILLTLTQDEVIAITTALAVAMATYQDSLPGIDPNSDIAVDVDSQLDEWRKVQFSIAKQRVLDARSKFNPAAKPI